MELTLAWQCQRWGVLPEAGGLLDQPAGLIRKMSAAQNVYNAVHAFVNIPAGKGAEWARQNPGMWKLINELWQLSD